MTAHLAVGHLLDVQFWLMGRDVEHPGGDLLVRLGFTREPARTPHLPSRYRKKEADAAVILWRCGLFLGTADHDCLLIRGFTPVIVPGVDPEPLFAPAEVQTAAEGRQPAPLAALADAARWFAAYEASVSGTVGVGHRTPKPGTRPALAPERPCSLESEWSDICRRLR